MMNKALLDRTPLWEIRPEEQVIPDINSLQTYNSREQAKLYYEANKEEIWTNTLRKKEKEIDRLNNIINRIDNFVDRTIEVIKHQPSDNDEWILERLNGIKYLIELKEE